MAITVRSEFVSSKYFLKSTPEFVETLGAVLTRLQTE
jgi:hypothetical protein